MTRVEEAATFAEEYQGDFGFMVAMREHALDLKPFSDKQIDAILRCKARDDRSREQFVDRDRVGDERMDPAGEPGMYRVNDDIFKVQRSRESGKLYAKKLVRIGGQRLVETDDVVHFEFEYDRGAIFTLRAQDRMSLEEAKAFGIRYGVCCVCGARLKDATSVENGIGPVCAGGV